MDDNQTVDINVLMEEYRSTLTDVINENIMLKAYIKQLKSTTPKSEVILDGFPEQEVVSNIE